MSHDVSVVTAFFDIGRGNWRREVNGQPLPTWLPRSNEQYLGWFRNLARLKNQMIIFTERKCVDAVLDMRRENGLEAMTAVMACDELFGPDGRLGRTVGLIERKMRPELLSFVQNPSSPEYWDPNYVLINALKSVFVNTAVKLSLNAHDQLAWIDFGYCRDDRRFDPDRPWRFDCADRMNLFHLREFDDRPIFDIVRSGDVYFQGCHIVGPARCWFELGRLLDEAMASLLACGLVDDDQTALLMAYRKAPDLFRVHAVDPADWFVVLRDFNHA